MTSEVRREAAGRHALRAWLLVGILFAAVTGAALWRAWPLLFPQVAETARLNPQCDLRAGSCRVEFASGGEVEFSIMPRTIPVVEPLQLQVRLRGVSASSVEVDFAGVDMNMGFNRVALQQTQPQEFVGPATLPVCVRDRMTWEAKVMLHSDRGLRVAPFRFDTFQP